MTVCTKIKKILYISTDTGHLNNNSNLFNSSAEYGDLETQSTCVCIMVCACLCSRMCMRGHMHEHDLKKNCLN